MHAAAAIVYHARACKEPLARLTLLARIYIFHAESKDDAIETDGLFLS